jgi:hypothetical protein
MRQVLPTLGTCLSLLALSWAMQVKAQDARPFEDVKPDHWAYAAVTDLQLKGVITGYPDHHFNGQRTLTRYEFAVALKRAVDKITVNPPETGHTGTAVPSGDAVPIAAGMPPGVTAAEVDELKRLTLLFKEELTSLGMDMKDVQSKVDSLARSVADNNHRVPHFNGDLSVGARSDQFHNGSTGYNGVGLVIPSLFANNGAPRTFQLEPHSSLLGGTRFGGDSGGFELKARFGSVTTKLFGGSFENAFGGADSIYGVNSLSTPIAGSTLQMAYPSALSVPTYYGGNDNGLTSSSGEFGLGGMAPGQVFGVHGNVPLSKYGEVGLTVLNFSAANPNNGSGFGSGIVPADRGAVYGANIRLNQIGRFSISGEAAKSVTQRSSNPGDGSNNDDNNAFLVNIGYRSGPLTATGGYQYYDPQYAAPGYWNAIGSWYNPTNVQGPFTRLGYRFSDALNANLGVDYLTGARNRPGLSGFTPGSSALRGLAGMRYHFSKQFELSAEYEGVLYDMSGAMSASGLRAKPVEQYITFGAGLNLTGNTILRLAYQIINVQDASNGFSAPWFGGSSPGAANTSVFTTQLAVHF